MINRSDNLVGMEEIGLRDLPSVLSGTVKKVQEGASVLLTRYNRPAVVIVSLEDFERLRTLDREASKVFDPVDVARAFEEDVEQWDL